MFCTDLIIFYIVLFSNYTWYTTSNHNLPAKFLSVSYQCSGQKWQGFTPNAFNNMEERGKDWEVWLGYLFTIKCWWKKERKKVYFTQWWSLLSVDVEQLNNLKFTGYKQLQVLFRYTMKCFVVLLFFIVLTHLIVWFSFFHDYLEGLPYGVLLISYIYLFLFSSLYTFLCFFFPFYVHFYLKEINS